ncbi:hypothetical protein G436_1288 [Leptospira interrogans serovar Hardjo str. Norma]|uniref:Uncharacterized protein n=1 Tax=Leptospira interrogans serovar Hardjo str. Norma TaxID=1279460 RepID=A0A0M3TL54_LEPIR|nr:hypothetical protein G436_1288 [Leptospira interrogans serovar Hardjo str. Norma]OOB92808.1 hypothetical protein B0191_20250 [Leptospira interrogans serovar Hardjo]QEH99280.1 hypothetical protein FWJ33_07440 [Leptospira interrogans serovar Hardjo]
MNQFISRIRSKKFKISHYPVYKSLITKRSNFYILQQLKKNVRVPTFSISLLWALEITQRLASMGARNNSASRFYGRSTGLRITFKSNHLS